MKAVITPSGDLALDMLRDRLWTFEPQLVAKYQRRLPGSDDHAINMYAREICGHLLEWYRFEVSPGLSGQ